MTTTINILAKDAQGRFAAVWATTDRGWTHLDLADQAANPAFSPREFREVRMSIADGSLLWTPPEEGTAELLHQRWKAGFRAGQRVGVLWATIAIGLAIGTLWGLFL